MSIIVFKKLKSTQSIDGSERRQSLNERHTAFDWIVASSRQMASQVLIVLLFFHRTLSYAITKMALALSN